MAVQEFAGEDMSDLFLEERETAIRQAQDEKRKVQMAVPGILGPHEIPEEMQDWLKTSRWGVLECPDSESHVSLGHGERCAELMLHTSYGSASKTGLWKWVERWEDIVKL